LLLLVVTLQSERMSSILDYGNQYVNYRSSVRIYRSSPAQQHEPHQ